MIARILLLLLAVAAALLPIDAALVERWYANGLYPHIQRTLTPVSNLTPVAWLDGLAIVAAVWLLVVWWRTLRQSGASAARRIGRGLLATVTAAALAYLVFLALWGLNYRRLPVEQRLALREQPASTADVVALGRDVVARVNRLHGPAHATRWTPAPWANPSLRKAFAEAQHLLGDSHAVEPGRLKSTLLGPFFRWTGVDGMINPFGLEVLANPDLLPVERPFVAAHEWAHLAGYADESEANFAGWLTAVRADAASQYSGWLYLYWQIAGELPDEERRLVARDLQSGPRSDLEAIVARLQRGDLPALRRATWKVYDSYLKANRVEAGVRSYGAVVSLVLRARFEDGWRPVRRSPP